MWSIVIEGSTSPFCIVKQDENGRVDVPDDVKTEADGKNILVRKAVSEDFNETILVDDVPEGITIPEKYYWE